MTAAPSVGIRSRDMSIIDRVFDMEDGYVLDFRNRTFAEFFKVSTMDPQARGYAFEKFLKDLFDAYGLSARASLTASPRMGCTHLGAAGVSYAWMDSICTRSCRVPLIWQKSSR